MLPLVFCLVGLGEPHEPESRPVPLLQGLGDELLTKHAKVIRQMRAAAEGLIATNEWLLKEGAERLSPKRVTELRQEIEEWREQIARMKRVERELELWDEEQKAGRSWESAQEARERFAKLYEEIWPGRPVAPMPREVQPRIPE